METKPGVLTTEFWLTVIGNVAVFLNLIGAWKFVPDKYAVLAGAIITALYNLSRGIAKSGVAFDPVAAKNARDALRR